MRISFSVGLNRSTSYPVDHPHQAAELLDWWVATANLRKPVMHIEAVLSTFEEHHNRSVMVCRTLICVVNHGVITTPNAFTVRRWMVHLFEFLASKTAPVNAN